MTLLANRSSIGTALLVFLLPVVWAGAVSGVLDFAQAGDAPLNAAVHDLVDHPDDFDGRLVLVTGYVGRVAWERGRRGSEYVEIRLDEAGIDVGSGEASVTVISWPGSAVKKCEHVLVQGVFHRAGKQAGRPYEFFIEADAVLRDAPTDAGRVPIACDKEI
jgi:hypothetical protein